MSSSGTCQAKNLFTTFLPRSLARCDQGSNLKAQRLPHRSTCRQTNAFQYGYENPDGRLPVRRSKVFRLPSEDTRHGVQHTAYGDVNLCRFTLIESAASPLSSPGQCIYAPCLFESEDVDRFRSSLAPCFKLPRSRDGKITAETLVGGK